MSEGWTETKLGEVFKSRRSKGRSGLPTLSVTLNNGLVERGSLERKTDTNLAPEQHLLVKKGDIAYNMMRMWQGALGLAHYDAIVSPAYIVLQPQKSIDPLFAEYLFKTPRFIHNFWAYSYGLTSDRLRLYYKDFGLIPVMLPPIAEQRKIAEILSTWDQAIRATESLVSLEQSLKRKLIQDLIENTGCEGGVESKSLGEIGKFYSGVTYSPEEVTNDGGMLVLRSSNIKSDRIVLDDNVFVRSGAKTSTLTKSGDVLICVRNGSRDLIGKTAQIDKEHEGLAHGAFMCLYRPYDPGFAIHLFKTEKFMRSVRRNLGATINSINTSEMRLFTFSVPSKERREWISSVLGVQDSKINKLVDNLNSLRSEKVALMQQLLTGKRRVAIQREAACA